MNFDAEGIMGKANNRWKEQCMKPLLLNGIRLLKNI
jgi:hypothetical protein